MAYSVSINSLIAEAMIELGLPDDSMKPIMLTWAKEAMKAIGGSKLFVQKTDWLPIEDLQFRKPAGYVAPLSIQLKDVNGNCIKPFMDTDTETCDCCENTDCICDVTVSEGHPTYIEISSNGISYTYAKMVYIGQPVGECGTPLVDGKAARAVKQYIKWQTTAQKRRRNRDDVPMSEVDYERRLWEKLADQAYGNIMMPNAMELEKLGVTWVTAGLSPSKFISRLYI